MTFWVAGAVVVSSAIGANAAKGAASTQSNAASNAADLQYKQWQEQKALQEPWRIAGVNALSKMQDEYKNLPPAFTGQVDVTQDPGYAFRLQEGLKALDRRYAAGGNLLSGGALKGSQRYAQDYASQEYQNAYNRALTSYNANVARESTGYNRLAGLAGIGQTATGQIGQAGQTMAGNVGNLMTGGAAASAAGGVGAANALTGGLSTYLNYNQGQSMLNALNQSRMPAGFTYVPGSGGYNYTYSNPLEVGPFQS